MCRTDIYAAGFNASGQLLFDGDGSPLQQPDDLPDFTPILTVSTNDFHDVKPSLHYTLG